MAARMFQGFEIDLTKDPVGDLPEGVAQVGYPSNAVGYNGAQHGWQWYAIQFDVDGAVKVTLEGCNFQDGYTGYVTDENGIKLGDIANDKCGVKTSWIYNSEEAKTLKVFCGHYCPYVKVEPVEYVAPSNKKEVTVVKTSFSDWTKQDVADKVMTQITKDITTKKTGETITFTLNGVTIYTGPGGKISSMDDGYLCGMKQDSPNKATIETSAFANITTVSYFHSATGNDRGWGLEVKGDGDEDWVTVYNTKTNSAGTLVQNIAVNRTNVKLRWFNLSPGNYAGLSQLEIKSEVEVTPRAFTDFKLDFRTNPYTVVAPAELPTGVVLENLSYNGNQHGLGSAKVTVPVDGPVRFTIGSCQYGDHTVTVKNGDVVISTIDNNNGCENGVSDIAKATYNNYVVWTYNVEEAATLTFELNGYLPFLFAEACDYIEQVDVTYYDVDGTKIGTKTIDGGSALVYAYGAEDVKVPAGKVFRGWFASTATNALKVAEGKAIEADLKLYARATDIETVAVGTVQEYDLTKNYFYIEDHENISAVNGKYHDNQHGFDFAAGGSLSVKVAGKAQVVASLCKYTKTDCKVTVTDENAKVVAEFDGYNEADGAAYAFNYLGDATTLTFTFSNVSYLHNLKVYNVENFVEKDAATGMYIIPAGDASSLLLALNNANSEGGTIFLPNGLYDLGATALTAVSSNVSIIGESMEGVVIKNRPVKEGIAITATLLLTGSNIYIQDVTLDCIAPYGTGDDTKSAERGVVIQDKGTNNILKNVYLKGLQDTYYSNGAEGMKGYFENCKIEGTVDFICGSGTVFFEQCLLYVADRTKSNSANVITAPNGYQSEKGYVFNGCKIDATANQTGIYNFGRPWNKYSTAAFINTTMLKAGSSDGWTSMNKVDGIRFHEFGTVDANGDAVTGHNLSKCETTGTKEELYLSSADGYDVVSILGDWAATAKAATVQAIADPQAIDADALYLVEDKEGNFVTIVKGEDFDADANAENTIRKANARGGFGEAVAVTNGTGTAVEAENADKEIVAIEYYSLSGQKMASPARGVNMVVKVYGDGTKSAQKVVVK